MSDIAKCFKDYDIRGKAPDQLNVGFALALGAALAHTLKPATAVIGMDARLSSPELCKSLAGGLLASGVAVTSIGLCGTEEIYHAAATQGFDVGVMITGSHNPANENGFKIVRAGAIPVGSDSGLKEIAEAMLTTIANPSKAHAAGQPRQTGFRREYMEWLLSHTDKNARPLRIVADAGNGCAGPFLAELAPHLPHEIVPLHFEPDGSFPNGVPNPLLPERRAATSQAVLRHNADFGAAFDGDFDRCFFFDHTGQMVESCYLIGLLAKELLAANPANSGAKIVHDARVYWLTRELVLAAGGIPVMSRGGHTRMKETMRRENALYGAEMSAHHFYRDFAYCDSGMLTFLLLANAVACGGRSLAELVAEGMAKYPCSGEINFKVADAGTILEDIWSRYAPKAAHADRLDGINLEFADWRFNLRRSNTEPLLRLNVESRGNRDLLAEKTAELAKFISAT